MKEYPVDPYFRVEVLAKTPNPQQVIWQFAHQCVCEGPAIEDPCPREDKAGEYVVKHLLAGNRGHYSPLESASIQFNVIGFNHRTMQQLTRHRHISPSVQSLRYTGVRLEELGKVVDDRVKRRGLIGLDWVIDQSKAIEECFYLWPAEKEYINRQGSTYEYTPVKRAHDLEMYAQLARWYYLNRQEGMPEEQAAGLLPMDTRQHFAVSMNVRAAFHVFDLRTKADSQLQIRQMCDLMWPHFKEWVPAIADWYEQNRFGKARLSP